MHDWDYRTNNALKNCSYCGQPVDSGNGWRTVGLCKEHKRIWIEDIKSGFKQNRLREIMVAIGEIQ